MTPTQFKDTPLGKAVRTFKQAFIVIAPMFLGIIALPEVQQYIASNVGWIIPLLAPVIAIVTYVYNKLEK